MSVVKVMKNNVLIREGINSITFLFNNLIVGEGRFEL